MCFLNRFLSSYFTLPAYFFLYKKEKGNFIIINRFLIFCSELIKLSIFSYRPVHFNTNLYTIENQQNMNFYTRKHLGNY